MVYVQEILDTMKICVVIPVYNESKLIGSIIKQIKQLILDVLVVDDGSSDGTPEIAGESGAVVIKNEKNIGKGASLSKGFDYALEHNFDAVITIDGDGQHSPSDIANFIRLAESPGSDIIIGNRMCDTGNMPLLRFFTNKFISWFISVITRQDIPDTQCGFRLIKKKVLEQTSTQTNKYEAESEILIKAARNGFKIKSVSIHTIYQGEISRINPFVDTYRFIRFIIKDIFLNRKQVPSKG